MPTGTTLRLMLATGAAFTILWLLLLRKRLDMKWYAAVILGILHVVCGVPCVRLFARMEGAGNGAMSLFGAVFFMPVAYYIGANLSGRKPATVFDIFAIPMIFTLMCARVNCLFAGCCLGKIIGNTAMRWPTREAELVFYIILLAIMIPKVWKNKTNGTVYPIYMIAYGGFRLIIEFFREASTNSLFHISHLWALIALAIGLSVYIEIRKRTIKAERSGKKRRK